MDCYTVLFQFKPDKVSIFCLLVTWTHYNIGFQMHVYFLQRKHKVVFQVIFYYLNSACLSIVVT